MTPKFYNEHCTDIGGHDKGQRYNSKSEPQNTTTGHDKGQNTIQNLSPRNITPDHDKDTAENLSPRTITPAAEAMESVQYLVRISLQLLKHLGWLHSEAEHDTVFNL